MSNPYWYRTVTATIENKSGGTLKLIEPVAEFDWGRWKGTAEANLAGIRTIANGQTSPPFVVESAASSTGCEGRLRFSLDGEKGVTWEIYWNNPFINCAWESNEYTQQRTDAPLEKASNDDDKTGDELAVVRYVCGPKPAPQGAEKPPVPDEHKGAAQVDTPTEMSAPERKGTYHVFIVDKHPNKHQSWVDKTKDGIISQLTEYFEKIAAKAGYTGPPKAEVKWATSFPSTIEDHEMVCYLRPRAQTQFTQDEQKRAVGLGDSSGMTSWNGTMMTEVWMDALALFNADTFIAILSNLIAHELMHQKLDAHPDDAGNKKVHNRPRPSLGVTPSDQFLSLTDEDRDDMAAALFKPYKQRKIV